MDWAKTSASKGRMRVSQTRSGRRPLRVSTLLKKEKDGSLYKETKMASVMAEAFLDELHKIGEGSALGKLINSEGKSGGSTPTSKKTNNPFGTTNQEAPPGTDIPAPSDDTQPPTSDDIGMSKTQSALVDEIQKISEEVNYKDAVDAIRQIKRLEKKKPGATQLIQGSMVGAAVSPLAGAVSDVISPSPLTRGPDIKPKMRILQGMGRGTRKVMGRSASGAVVGSLLPMGRHFLAQEAEKAKLREYLGVSKGGKTRRQVKKTLGL